MGSTSTPGGHKALGEFLGIDVVPDDTEFEVRRLADDLNGACGVGKAGQLDLNAMVLLLADIRFSHTELVDAVAYGLHSLIEGHVLDMCALLFLERRHITQLPAVDLDRGAHG